MDVVGIVKCIIKLGKEISEINEKVSSNQSSCRSLTKRISGIFEYIQHLKNEDTIYLKSLEEVMKVLEEAKEFMVKFVVKKKKSIFSFKNKRITEWQHKMDLIRTRNEDSETFCDLNERLTLVCQDLNLGIQVSALNISIEGCEDNKRDVEDMRDMINSLFEEVRGNQELLKELNDANVSFVDLVRMNIIYIIHNSYSFLTVYIF
jgi:chromosome segregation ATPase